MSLNASLTLNQDAERDSAAGSKIGLADFLLILYIASVPILSGTEDTAKVSQALGVALAGTFVLLVIWRRRRLKLPAELLIFASFLAYVAIGGFIAREPEVVLARLFTLFQLWVLAVVMFNLLTARRGNYFLGWQSYVLGVLLAASVSLMFGGRTLYGRLAGTFANPNAYGLALLLGIGGISVLPVRTRMSFLGRVGALVILFTQVVQTGSRKAILGAVILLALNALLLLRRNMVRPVRAIVLLLVFAIAGATTIGWLRTTPHWNRMENLIFFIQGEDVPEVSVYERTDLVAAGLVLWQKSPLIGLGADQYRFHAPDLGLRETYSHSNPVEILANFGLFGFVLYYGIYIRLTWRLWAAWRKHKYSAENSRVLYSATALWVTWVGLEIARVTYLAKDHWILFGLLLAMTYRLEKMDVTTSARDVPRCVMH